MAIFAVFLRGKALRIALAVLIRLFRSLNHFFTSRVIRTRDGGTGGIFLMYAPD
jgi:hypothetical protein